MGLALAVASGLVLALAAPWVCRHVPVHIAGWMLALAPLGGFVYFAAVAGSVVSGETVRFAVPWVPGLGIDLSLQLDGLGLVYALLICATGALVFGYAGTYMSEYERAGRFFAVLLLFTSAMLGIVVADNAIALFIFWELTSIASYLLIGFHNERGAARAAAWQALLVTSLGGQALLIALLLIGSAAGGYEISAWVGSRASIQASGVYPAALTLLLIGCFSKSALVPFHFWLPSAMQAPSPVSAYLHSATMVQAGVFLLARMHPILGGSGPWIVSVTLVGAGTVLVGSYLAVLQAAFKAMLAYSTIAMLGASALLLGIGTPIAVQAALFLAAGAVERGAGVTGVAESFGLWARMPKTAAATVLAGAAMAGLPPFLGFVGKERVYGAVIEAEAWVFWLVPVTLIAFTAATTVAALLALRPFLHADRSQVDDARDPPAGLWLPVAVLSGMALGLGVMPGGVARFLAPATAAVVQTPADLELTLWHGFTRPLGLSVGSIVAGIALFAVWDRWHDRMREHQAERFGPGRWYDLTIEALLRTARIQTRVIQSGYLRVYLMIALLTTVVLVGWAVLRGSVWEWQEAGKPQSYEAALAALIVAAAFAAVLARALVTVVLALGVVGFSVAIVYVLFSAPDLAMTQFLVETVTVIMFVLIFYRLPRMAGRPSHTAVVRDAVLATAAGGLMTLLLLATIAVPRYPEAAEFFLLRSVPDAHGRNVVNTILVDFRALDTLGEVVVLGTVAVGVYVMIRQTRRALRARSKSPPEPVSGEPGRPPAGHERSG